MFDGAVRRCEIPADGVVNTIPSSVMKWLLGEALLIDCVLKRGMARQRALKLAQAALPGAQLNGSRDRLEVRWLAPRDHLIADVRHPGERQDNITCHIALLWLWRTRRGRGRSGRRGHWKRAITSATSFLHLRCGRHDEIATTRGTGSAVRSPARQNTFRYPEASQTFAVPAST